MLNMGRGGTKVSNKTRAEPMLGLGLVLGLECCESIPPVRLCPAFCTKPNIGAQACKNAQGEHFLDIGGDFVASAQKKCTV